MIAIDDTDLPDPDSGRELDGEGLHHLVGLGAGGARVTLGLVAEDVLGHERRTLGSITL